MNNESGFTLIEMLVVIAILMIVAYIAVPISINQIQTNKLETEAKKLKSSMQTQQQYAYSANENSAYGIKYNTNSYVLYSGNTYATAVLTDTTTFPSGITISQTSLANSSTELNFSKNSFRPDTTGSITLVDGVNSYSVTVNSEGLIEIVKN